jgi:DNA-binding CsgD family transcriptional regulator
MTPTASKIIDRRSPDGSEIGSRAVTPLHADDLAARRWAVNEVGAAMAHELVEPLTALLLYMHEMKWLSETAPGAVPLCAQRVLEGALCETVRVCAIMERIGNRFEVPLDFETTINRGRDAINWWSRAVIGGGERPVLPPDRPGIARLTAREREVLQLISEGDTNKVGALRLKISPRTFESHRAQIMRKLGAKNTADLLRKVLIGA